LNLRRAVAAAAQLPQGLSGNFPRTAGVSPAKAKRRQKPILKTAGASLPDSIASVIAPPQPPQGLCGRRIGADVVG